MKFSKKLITIFALLFATCAFANGNGNGNCPEDHDCGHNGGQNSSGGTNNNGGSSTSISTAVSDSVSAAGAISSSTSQGLGSATASVNSSGSGYGGSQTQSNGNIKSYSLSAASVGSPTNGTCAAHVALLFGLATFPVTLESCVALNEAAFLVSVIENKQAAIERLCQLSSIAKTSLCPKWESAEAKAKEPPQ